MPENTPGFIARLGIALGAFFRLLFDGAYAAQLLKLEARGFAALPAAEVAATAKAEAKRARAAQEAAKAAEPSVAVATKPERDLGPALQLLELLQREGRFLDFVQQDIVTFSDSDVGAAARIVHQGCRRALEQVSQIETVRSESEGSTLTLEAGFDAKSHRLVGNVQGQPPYRGTLKHRGWRISKLTLEEPLPGAVLSIIAQAEIEL